MPRGTGGIRTVVGFAAAMELHEVDHAEFRDKGFAVFRGAFGPDEIAAVRRRLDEVMADLDAHEARVAAAHRGAEAAHPMEGAPEDVAHLVEQQRRLPEFPELALGDRHFRRHNRVYPRRYEPADPQLMIEVAQADDPWQIFNGQIHGLADFFPELREAAAQPRLADIMARVLAPNVVLWADHIFAKGACNDVLPYHGANRFHQDGFFQFDRRTVTCWVALEAVTRENGPLHYLPLSAGYGQFDFDDLGPDALSLEILQQEEVVTLEPGDVAVHDRWTLHATGPNLTSSYRRGWALHYTNAEARFGEFSRPMADATKWHVVTEEGHHIRNGRFVGNLTWPLICGVQPPHGVNMPTVGSGGVRPHVGVSAG